MRRALPLILFLLLIQPAYSDIVTDTFNITMDNTRAIYLIDYGPNYNITLINYTISSSVNLDPVQSWGVYGCTDTTWNSLDSQDDVSFVADDDQLYNVSSSTPYRYYGFAIFEGFYEINETITLALTTNQTHIEGLPTEQTTPVMNLMQEDIVYISSESAGGGTDLIPWQVWAGVAASAILFFFLSLITSRAAGVTAMIAVILSGVSAYTSNMIGFVSVQVSAVNTSEVVIEPVAYAQHPPWLVYIFLGRYFLRGLLAGSLKG
jgi:hypothetical protein